MHRKSYQAPHRGVGAGILLVLLLALPLASALADDPEYGCLAAAKRALTVGKSSRPVAEGTIHYDVREYRLTVNLDPAETEYTGEVYVRFAPQLQDFTDFVLDVVDLEILSVTGGDGPLPFVQTGDSLMVTLPLTKVGADDSVTVAYRGELGDRNQEGLGNWPPGIEGLTNSGPCIATFSQPEFARTWWPCKDRPYDKAPTTVTITAPDDLTAVSIGALQPVVDNGDGTKTWTWVESHPIAPYLVSLAVSEYAHFGETCITDDSTIAIDNWVFPDDYDDAVTDFTPLCDMMDFLEDLLGPYPFADEKYGHVEYLNTLSGAMEHQTVTSYGMNLIRGDNYYDWIVIHELAHQWFGDSLTPETWPDIWLNEGFASYSEALWREHLYGMDGDGVHNGYWWKMRYIRWENDWIGQTTVYDPFPLLDKVVYDKGSWILHMLRGRMGDTNFFALLDDWATGSDRPEGVVTTDEFIALATAHAGEDLAAFFDPWLNENTVPHLEIATSVEGGFGTGTELTVRLTDRSGVAFDNKYPLLVVTDAGEEWRTIRLVGAEHAETFGFGSPVQSAQLDPKGWVAWREVTAAPTAVRLLRAVPNPSFNGVVGFMYRLEHDDDVSLQVYDARGHRIFERDLGPVLGTVGDQEALWAGWDSDGRPVTSGVYWARLEAGGASSVLKFSVVR